MKEINVDYIMAVFAVAILACQTAYESTLFQAIKKFLYLEDTRQPKWKLWFNPIGVVIDKFRELVNCCYCSSFWYLLGVNYFIWEMPIIYALLYAPLAILFVHMYRIVSLNE